MGITVTPFPNASPPYMQISISSSSGDPVTAISMTRTVSGSTFPTRMQPSPGPSPRIVFDYEADWEINVVYSTSVTTSSGTETFNSNPTTLTPNTAWMIHPVTPSLSCVFDTRSYSTAGVVSIADVTRASTATQHDIIGSAYRLITKSGPRSASRTQITYQTTTESERAKFVALITDQTPLLIRVPTYFKWAFENGYYDIGDVAEARFSPIGDEPRRNFTFTAESVFLPAGTQNSIRNYADVLAQNGTYSDITARYASYVDLLTDTRR